jgi:cation diffusion facilitator CzcD-associated flavoprotein CzcO
MAKALQNRKELVEKLIPSFDVGCRRPTPGNGFLEALVEDNVSVSFGQPQRITEKGLITHDGQLIEADAIVCATGFDLSFKPRFSLIGREGKDLRNVWTPDAKAYMTHSVPGFPNYFGMSPPPSPPIHPLTSTSIPRPRHSRRPRLHRPHHRDPHKVHHEDHQQGAARILLVLRPPP